MIYVRKLRVKQYKIVITDGANKQIGQFLRYVRNTLCNEQAYESLKEDIAYVIEIHHELEDYMTENNTKKDIIVGIAKGEELISPEFDFDKNDDEIVGDIHI